VVIYRTGGRLAAIVSIDYIADDYDHNRHVTVMTLIGATLTRLQCSHASPGTFDNQILL